MSLYEIGFGNYLISRMYLINTTLLHIVRDDIAHLRLSFGLTVDADSTLKRCLLIDLYPGIKVCDGFN